MKILNAATLAAAAILLASGAACAQEPSSPSTSAVQATPTRAENPDVHPFKIGMLDAYALRDGGLMIPNDNKTLAVGESAADTNALLTAAGLATDTLSLSLQPLLVKTGDRVILFDTGAGGQMGTQGKLLASLGAAGVEPPQVTDILISHAHGDHVGGLVNGQGVLNFPNAIIRMTVNEWTALKADTQMAALVTAITPKVETFQPNASVAPGVTAVDIAGHTPGHTGYLIASGTESLLYFGDAMHHPVISVQRPDWTIAFDGNEAVAEASRKALLERAATENLRLYGFHFTYPGLGRVKKVGDGFVWVPEVQAN